jgi:hypothetical protein
MGDRVSYVIMPHDPKHSKIFDAAEDPAYCVSVLESYPSQEWLIENQLKKPITRALEPVIGAEAVHELFHGQHTRKRKRIMPKTGGLAAFFLRGDEAEAAKEKKNTAIAAASAAAAEAAAWAPTFEQPQPQSQSQPVAKKPKKAAAAVAKPPKPQPLLSFFKKQQPQPQQPPQPPQP